MIILAIIAVGIGLIYAADRLGRYCAMRMHVRNRIDMICNEQENRRRLLEWRQS